jgi:hypothetical protein
MTVTTFGGGGSGLPSVAGNVGKYLYTDGLTASWNSVPKGLTLIQNQSSISASTISFSAIPTTYTHLKIIGFANIGNGSTVSFSVNNWNNNGSGYLYHNGGTAWSGGYSSTHYLVPYVYSGGSSFELTIPYYNYLGNHAWHCMSGSVGTSYSFGLSGGNFSGTVGTISINGNNGGVWNISLYGMD